jgi:hypothetical protein
MSSIDNILWMACIYVFTILGVCVMKLFYVILLAFVLSIPVYSQTTDEKKPSEQSFMEVQMLINQDLDDNYQLINQKSQDLTQVQRMFIYDDKKVSGGLPFVLNFFLCFGIGSWVQGHTAGGLIGTIGNLTGLILIASDDSGGSSTATIGSVIFLSTWIVDCILPWTYSSSYNRKLKSALGINAVSSIDLAPTLNMAQDGTIYPGIGLSVAFK